LQQLRRFSLVRFEHDSVLTPSDSAHFQSFDDTTQHINISSCPNLRDGLGLGLLFDQGRLRFINAPFEHMQFTRNFLKNVVISELNVTAADVTL